MRWRGMTVRYRGSLGIPQLIDKKNEISPCMSDFTSPNFEDGFIWIYDSCCNILSPINRIDSVECHKLFPTTFKAVTRLFIKVINKTLVISAHQGVTEYDGQSDRAPCRPLQR